MSSLAFGIGLGIGTLAGYLTAAAVCALVLTALTNQDPGAWIDTDR